MAEQDSTTTKQEQKGIHWSDSEGQEVIGNLLAVRAIGDLMCMASYTASRSGFRDVTLAGIGMHLEKLTAEALVILRWENPKPQAAAQGGEA